jgi:F0F1-type ATP synthase delta subunit
LKIALKIVSDEPLDVDQLDSLKQRIEKKLEREVELEFIFGIKR